jgi:hypothetical protein
MQHAACSALRPAVRAWQALDFFRLSFSVPAFVSQANVNLHNRLPSSHPIPSHPIPSHPIPWPEPDHDHSIQRSKWRHNSTSCRAASRDCVAGAEPDHDRSVQEVCSRLAHRQWRGLSQPQSIAHSLIDPCSPRGPQPLYSQCLLGPRDPLATLVAKPRYPLSHTRMPRPLRSRTSAVSGPPKELPCARSEDA